ncbi:hypothetical protein AZE42_09864 [Rhizopogon vesiculosus]|uniref:Uncharacterized protein n=1 Tax=Rhizopogon vesiculosus TaxID=180088 RepID=A0A1J8QQ56_9AGAM|nr:hypothetical protein AZE42_09864 [Rhizopogon vesiculosus]
MNSDLIQRRRPTRREPARLPQGFFDGMPGNVHSSGTRRNLVVSPSSTSRSHGFLGRFTSFFHRPQPIIGGSMEPQQPERRSISSRHLPRDVEVAPVRDKQALYVSPRQEPVSERVKGITNPTWWTRCVLFICCVSVPSTDTNGHQ